MNNNPIRPNHYTGLSIEPIKVIQDWKLNFCLGNAIKYISRAGRKEGNSALQDLQKATQYLLFEIKAIDKSAYETFLQKLYDEAVNDEGE